MMVVLFDLGETPFVEGEVGFSEAVIGLVLRECVVPFRDFEAWR